MNYKKIGFMLVICFVINFSGCTGKVKIDSIKNYNDRFLEVTRYIMTRDELEIYKHLPDKKAREEFAVEFWEKRDPSFGTPENENKDEYEKRIRFANQRFKERPDGKGYDTDRGRILLQMGFPDERNVRVTTRRGTTWQIRIEEWYYYGYRVALQFIDDQGQGRFIIDHFPSILRKAMDRVKFSINLTDKKALTDTFKFKAVYQKDAIVVSFPVKHIQFQWDGKTGKMNAPFEIDLFVYDNFKKKEHLSFKKKISGNKKEILAKKNVKLKLPYTVTAGKNYFFELIIKDPVTGSRYRNFCRHK